MTTTFSERQYDLAYPDGVEFHWWTMARSHIVADVIAKQTLAGSPVIEVGCGRGVAVENLRALGIEASGVELAAVDPLLAVAQYVKTSLDAVSIPEQDREQYRTLLLLDVIEHMPEPVGFVQTLLEAFPNVSLLIVTVPAGQELWSNYDEFYGHYRRYSLPMLKQLADNLNWEMVKESYFFHALYLPARLLAILGKKRQTRIAAPQRWQKWWHRMMALVMKIEYLMLPKYVKGTSAIACYKLADRKG
ncbi:MAG: methyltransferase domain-containing protein [Pseudomonadales bacterium]